MKKLVMALVIGLGLVLVLPPAESVTPRPAVCQVITYLPAGEAGIQPDPNPYHRLYEEMLYPTVRITTPEGRGSGVILKTTDNTYILSAAHVVGKYSEVQVEIYREATSTSLTASVVMTDTNKDLALLRVLGVSAVKTAKLAPRDYTPYIFTPVWVVGCSLGLPPRPSSGQICAICGLSWEISAPILPGNSGGPVYDAKTYQVIGIVVWARVYNGQLVTTMAGVVPIQTIYEFLDSIPKKGGE